MNYIDFKNISKIYNNTKKQVLKDFNLSIKKGEFIVIVGPSGSGKSTLLELICGFEEATTGEIYIDNILINKVHPKDRDVSMVFQNYALFPHMTIYENIDFGMKIRKINKSERKKKVMWAANMLQIEEYLDKKPKELSGGQRQRVALARAMVREPKLFLMDEPLSNLDAKLRYSTCNEITNLHKSLNATTIYVTHDQIEALTMADRIVVLDQGEIKQVGTPMEIYKHPKNVFVAKFIGKPQINLFDLTKENNKLVLNNNIIINEKLDINDGDYILGLRPEHIQESNENYIEAEIIKIDYLGGEIILHLSYMGTNFTMKTFNEKEYRLNSKIKIKFNLEKASIFDKYTNENIRREENEKNY